MRTVAMLRHFPPVRRVPTATRCPARRSGLAAAARRESLRVLGIGFGLGAAAGGAAVGDAACERHVECRDLQELLALAGIAQALGRARTLQRLSSVLVTLGHGANSVTRMCQNLNDSCVAPLRGFETRHTGVIWPAPFPLESQAHTRRSSRRCEQPIAVTHL